MNTLADAIQPYVDRNYLAGAVLLAATKDRVLSCETVGFADIAEQRPMTPETVFWIASMTKPITGAALMMLVDEGKVSLDDPVEKHLYEFKGQKVIAYQDDDVTVLKKPCHPITVREVLCHTAGLAFATCVESPTLDGLKLRDSVRSHAMLPLHSEPGTKYAYSNGGTNTAGRIIEVVTGQSYEDFLDQRLIRPLGMKDTTFWPSAEQLARTAKAYRTTDDKTGLAETKIAQLAYPLQDHYRKPMPAGGLFSTAADCAKFCQMILNGGVLDGRRYLSEEAITQLTTKQTGPEVSTEYGLGWVTENGVYGHSGAAKTDMRIEPRLGLIRIFLIQLTNDWRDPEGDNIMPAFRAAAEKLLER